MKYFIYQITIGASKYVGKTIQTNPNNRLRQHIKLLTEGKHHTDELQRNWHLTKEYKHEIIKQGKSLFHSKIALIEQRMINRHSNCNEIKAAKTTKFSLKELAMNLVDFTVFQWKFVAVIWLVVFSIMYSS